MSRRLVTAGEELLNLLKTEVHSVPSAHAAAAGRSFASRLRHCFHFADGMSTLYLFARLVRLAESIEADESLRDALEVRARLTEAMLDKLELGQHNCRDLAKLIDATFAAVKVTTKKVSPRVRTQVLEEYRRVRELSCYMCGGPLAVDASRQMETDIDLTGLSAVAREQVMKRLAQPNPQFVEFDHVWPRSLGGDSTAENILPACPFCNRDKDNLLSWEWALVQTAIWPPSLSPDRDIGDVVQKRIKIALHLRAAMCLADQDTLSLKEALIQLGPRTGLRTLDPNDTADFFNLAAHDESKLELLWSQL